MIYVVAGNKQQAEHYARYLKLKPKDYLYVSSANMMRGRIVRENVDAVVHVGVWYMRKDMEEIERTIALCKLGGLV